MRGKLETIVGAMFAGKTSELLKRILWAKHQNKKIIVIKPIIDNRYNQEKIITHNDLSHDCFSMKDWKHVNDNFKFNKDKVDVVFLDEIQFMNTEETIENVETYIKQWHRCCLFRFGSGLKRKALGNIFNASRSF